MLDNCSRKYFVKSSFVKKLRIKGHKTSVSVKTLTGEKSHSDDVKVELLIGANCTRALGPVQVIASRDRGPHAMKSWDDALRDQ